jgi:hypothetical protein
MACFCPSWKIDSWMRPNTLNNGKLESDIAEYLIHHGDVLKEQLKTRYIPAAAAYSFATFHAALINELAAVLSVALSVDLQTVLESLDYDFVERVLGKEYFQF